MRNALLLSAILLASAWPAAAFVGDQNENGQQQRWRLVTLDLNVHTNVVNRQTRAVRYFIAEDAYSATNTAAEYLAVRASFEQWQAISNSVLKFEFAGLSPAGMDVNPFDTTNIVYWAKNSTLVYGGQDNIAGRLGVCYTGFFEDNTLMGADVVLNAVTNKWTADFFAPTTDAIFIESVLVHELGHFIGINHSPLGGATMLFHGDVGISSQAGLSTDEIMAVQTIYAPAGAAAQYGHLKGRVTKNGVGVLGAALFLEDANGNAVAGTVSRTNGLYSFPSVPPGNYQLRVSPLDPYTSQRLLAGPDIEYFEFVDADVNFLPSPAQGVTLTAGATNTVNLAVTNGAPAFRIFYLRHPTANPNQYLISSLPIVMKPGQSNLTIGVFSPSLPSSGLNLQVSGQGISHGTVTSHPLGSPFSGLAGVSVIVNIASNAVPGFRSLVVTRNSDQYKAYANGFLDLQEIVPDYNFDGLDDRFQRQYFPLFTAPEAGPAADPDGDGHNNAAEYIAGTIPTNAASVVRLESLTQTQAGTTIRWQSVTGKKYQVFGRSQATGSPWQALGSPVIAIGAQAQYFDAGPPGPIKFYRVQVLP